MKFKSNLLLTITFLLFAFTAESCIAYYEMGDAGSFPTNYEKGDSAKDRIVNAAILNDLFWSSQLSKTPRFTMATLAFELAETVQEDRYYKVKDVDKCVMIAGQIESILINSGAMLLIECNLTPVSNAIEYK